MVMKTRGFNTVSMLTAALLITMAWSPTWASDLEHSWSAQFGDVSNQNGFRTVTDGSGNLILVAAVSGTADFGGGPRTSTSGNDVAIAKFDAAGNHIWSQIFAGFDSQYPYAVAVDRWDNLLVAGTFYGDVDFGGGVLSSVGVTDLFLAKFDADGNHIWSQEFGGSGYDYGRDIAVDGAGSVILVGDFQESVDFGGGSLASAGSSDFVVAKYDNGGNHAWSQRFGDSSAQYGRSVSMDAAGNLIIAGDFSGSVDFGGGPLSGAGGTDIYVVKFDGSLSHQWSQSFGDPSNQYCYGVAADPSGNVVLLGYGYAGIDFGGGPLPGAGGYDVYLAKFDPDGNHQWSKLFGDANSDNGRSVAVDAAGNITIAGYFQGNIDFGGGPLNSLGSNDVFVATFDAGGSHLWSRRFGDSGNQYCNGASVDAWGNFAVTGQYNGTLDFGGGPLTCAGGYDIYIARFWRLAPDIHAIRDVPGDEGGYVNLAFDASGVDNPGEHTITHYTIWRAIDQLSAAAALAGGATLVTEPPAAATIAPGRYVRVEETAGQTYYWENIHSVTAYYLTGYSATVPTLFDSTSVSTELHHFQVIAHTSDPYTFYISEPASGYSVDNLPPGILMGLAGEQTVAPDGLELTWLPNPEADLSHYVVHRGTAENFVPNSATLIASPSEEAAFDSQWLWDSGYYYKVAAVDEHGNVGPYALLIPEVVVSTGDDIPTITFLGQNHPNPFNPQTTISYGLAEAGDVTLRIYDAGGRLVRTLVDGAQSAGSKSAVWDGRDDAGRAVASGVYFYCLRADAFEQTRKMVFLK
jgi:hypothetical protein